MAKLKNIDPENKVEQPAEAETTKKTEDGQPAEAEVETEVAPKVIEGTAIPEYVNNVLKKYPNYAILAVDTQGGVYTEDSLHLSKGIVALYKNPYYK